MLTGCEGSIVRDATTDSLFLSVPNNAHVVRLNMTVFQSADQGASWQEYASVDSGSVAYSSLQVLPNGGLGLLYERSDNASLVFEPQEIRYWVVNKNL